LILKNQTILRLYSQIVELHSRRDIRRQSAISNTLDAAAAATLNGSIKEEEEEGEGDGSKKKEKIVR
jgi:hypothetical protein